MAVIRNVRVKVRISALVSELTMKGNLQNRPGRESATHKVVVDAPVHDLPLTEYNQRKADIDKVLNRGWQLIAGEPPEVFLGDLSCNNAGIVSMSGKVTSNNVSTTCGFQVDIVPTFTSVQTVAANETPVQSVDDAEKITGSIDVHLFPGFTFYIRAFANDGTKTVYSIVKSIEIPTIV